MRLNRRKFIKTSAAAAGAAFLSSKGTFAMSSSNREHEMITGPMPQRTLGTTGLKLSILGFGGIVVMNAQPADAAKVVSEAVDKGINYFDVAPTYGDAELKLGPALKPYRKKCFLACKTNRRDKAGAREELDNSLKRLQTDHFDLYQLHGIIDVEKDVKAALAKDGAIQTFIEARKAGIIRYIGFSAHTPKAALAAMREFDFDTILYPINFCTHFRANFDQEVLEEAKKRNMGILALKAMARQKWQSEEDKKKYPKCWYEPIDDLELSRLALSWTLSQSITALIPPGEEKLFRLAMDLAPSCGEPTSEELTKLEKLSNSLEPIFPE